MIPKCTSRFGHKFEGRYSRKPPDLSGFAHIKIDNPTLELMIERIYEGDICVRCGARAEKLK